MLRYHSNVLYAGETEYDAATVANTILTELRDQYRDTRCQVTLKRLLMKPPEDRELQVCSYFNPFVRFVPYSSFQVCLEMWAIKHGISERAVDSSLFKNFLRLVQRLSPSKDPGQIIQTRKTRSEVIVDTLYNGIQSETKRELKHLECAISTTTDAWTSFHSQNK